MKQWPWEGLALGRMAGLRQKSGLIECTCVILTGHPASVPFPHCDHYTHLGLQAPKWVLLEKGGNCGSGCALGGTILVAVSRGQWQALRSNLSRSLSYIALPVAALAVFLSLWGGPHLSISLMESALCALSFVIYHSRECWLEQFPSSVPLRPL